MNQNSEDTLKLNVLDSSEGTGAHGEDPDEEQKRSFWGIAFVAITFAVITALLFWIASSLSGGIGELGSEQTWSQNLGFLFLINGNIVLVMVFAFLVIKNVVKLILDRRRGILGSRIRTKLVATFVGLALVPTVFLFLVSRGILNSVLQMWFSPHITTSVDGAVALARFQYRTSEAQARRELIFLVQNYQEAVAKAPGAHVEAKIMEALEKKREEYFLRNIVIADNEGKIILGVHDPDRPELTPTPDPDNIAEVSGVSRIVHAEQTSTGEVVRGYVRIDLPPELAARNHGEPALLITTREVSPEFSRILAGVLDAFQAYQELKTFRIPLASSSVLTLVVVTLMVIFAAIWVGFYLARTLTVPIQMLAEGTQAVARGNLDYRIPETGRDEVSLLVHSFNTMTEDLKRITDELVRRRRYMETILASVDIGVMTVDNEMKITTCNRVAAEMLGKKSSDVSIGAQLDQVLPREINQQFSELLTELDTSSERTVTGTISLHFRGKTKHLHIVIAELRGEGDVGLGTVVLFDDLTELVNVQRVAAWQEVARRMAHEFKNPLTPIQLSAQRIQRRLVAGQMHLSGDDTHVIQEGTETIVQQVDVLKKLVDEFSRFARMPQLELKTIDLPELCRGVLSLFRQAHPGIDFDLSVEGVIPKVRADSEQLGRVFVNFLENAVAAIHEKMRPSSLELDESSGTGMRERGRVAVAFSATRERVIVEVSDNGVGFGDVDRARLFEPYFSTKKGGTGLGLAIVQAILADHHASVQVRDNAPRGALFSVEFPIA